MTHAMATWATENPIWLATARNFSTNATLPGGLVTAMTDGATVHGTDLDRRVSNQQRLLDLKRSRLEARFARMESALAMVQSQGQQLQSQLSNLSKQSGN